MELQRTKESGLYVDVRKDGTVSSPEDFREMETKRHLKLVEGRYRRFRRLFNLFPYASESQLLQARKQWEASSISSCGNSRFMGPKFRKS